MNLRKLNWQGLRISRYLILYVWHFPYKEVRLNYNLKYLIRNILFYVVIWSITLAYWIDGIDKSTHERFDLNNSCTPGEIDFSGMLPVNLVLTPKQCLALVKGSSASNSRIQATDCIIPNRVLCSFALNGCAVPTTTISSG